MTTVDIQHCTADIYVQFSQELYVVDESASYAILKVTVNGLRASSISVNVKVFVSNEFQPKAGSYMCTITITCTEHLFVYVNDNCCSKQQ